MSYLVVSPNGNITIEEQSADNSTSLTLVGKNFTNWGEPYAQNFVDLLENFANSLAPTNPRRGQLWYDIPNAILKVYNGSDFVPTTPEIPSPTINMVGDVIGTGSLANSVATTLANVLDPSKVDGVYFDRPAIKVDAKGRIIDIENNGGDGSGPPQFVISVRTANTTAQSGNVIITSQMVVDALGFAPYPASNPAGYAPNSSVDLSGYLGKSGGTMSGTLNMNGNRITNLPTPIDAADPARKSDVDALTNGKTQRVFNGAPSTTYNVTVSTAPPSGGSEGDVWYRY